MLIYADLRTVNYLSRHACMLQEMYLTVLLLGLIELLRSFLSVAFIISLLWIPPCSSHLLGLAYVSTPGVSISRSFIMKLPGLNL